MADKKIYAIINKGILADALSPHPYLFWLSVGGPIMTKDAFPWVGIGSSIIDDLFIDGLKLLGVLAV